MCAVYCVCGCVVCIVCVLFTVCVGVLCVLYVCCLLYVWEWSVVILRRYFLWLVSDLIMQNPGSEFHLSALTNSCMQYAQCRKQYKIGLRRNRAKY